MTPQGVLARQLRALDRRTTEDYGVPTLLLMEHAGCAVAQIIQSRTPLAGSAVVCLAGRGHNGGDGLAALRLLHCAGYAAEAFLLGTVDRLRDEVAAYARMLTCAGIPMHELTDETTWDRCAQQLAHATWIIDALLGIGFHPPLTPETERAIRLINTAGPQVIAVDTPSGLDVDTGAVATVAVRATITVTFGLPKCGFFTQQGPARVGELLVDPITFPPALLAEMRTV